jgi:hypothetical protein
MLEGVLTRWIGAGLDDTPAQPAFLSDDERRACADLTRGRILWTVLEHDLTHRGRA